MSILPLVSMLTLAQLGAPARNVVVVTIDGLRPSELFTGGARELMRGVEDEAGLVSKYWREEPLARRTALMPFVWSVVAREGQLVRETISLGEEKSLGLSVSALTKSYVAELRL